MKRITIKKIPKQLKNVLITIIILLVAFGLSVLLLDVLTIQEHVTTVFVFAVFLVSLWTDGYWYGIITAFVGMLAVNWGFTFPFFAFNFTIPENLLSAIIMIIVSLLTSTLTTKVKHSEEMKAIGEKERMRANLLRAVSHDLRTPLTTIYGASSTMIENYENVPDEQKLKILGGIKEDAQWLIRMVENLLSVTKIGEGKVKLIKTPTVLEELIDAVIIKFKKHYPAQDVDLDIPEEIVLIPMDAILIEQVLINLLENAVQHATGMTELSLKVFVLGDKAIFEVKDNGFGIPQERMATIFQGNYEDQEKLYDEHKRNAGIGLSVCATIIKAHGGAINAENRKEGGAKFRFSLDVEEIKNEQ